LQTQTVNIVRARDSGRSKEKIERAESELPRLETFVNVVRLPAERWRLASGSPVMVLKRAGIVRANGEPKYVFHALHHFFASVEIKLGRNPKELQTEMGHEKIELTMNTYGHLFPNNENEEHSAAFEAFVLSGGGKTCSRTAANTA
jgi:integrase